MTVKGRVKKDLCNDPAGPDFLNIRRLSVCNKLSSVAVVGINTNKVYLIDTGLLLQV